MPEIAAVEPNSLAEDLALKPGDKIVAINGFTPRDYIDFQLATGEPSFEMTIKKKNSGEIKNYTVKRQYGQPLGIRLEEIIFDELKTCTNDCLFCFINQLPPNLRNSLYQKDDDYRFSFLQGSFITLTNLSEREMERIKDDHLSPLNVSVHTTNPELRAKMMGNQAAAKIKKQLSYFSNAGIKFNAQVVVCPEINDGQELERTISDLEDFYPNLISLGLVPVGITRYNRQKELKSFTPGRAKKLLNRIAPYQERLIKRYDKDWIYPADEFYLLADHEIPEEDFYHDYPQLENGIGLTRLTRNTFFSNCKKEVNNVKYDWLGIVTSVLGKKALIPVIEKLKKIPGIKVKVFEIKNRYLGSEVTVTGLLSGKDILQKLSGIDSSGPIVIPEVALNKDDLFIDDMSWAELQQELSGKNLIRVEQIKDVIEVIENE